MDERLNLAVLETLHYADIFDYVLTRDELARYLIGVQVAFPEIDAALTELVQRGACAVSPEGFLSLPGRERLTSQRLRLREQARSQKARAHLYARLLGYFPFVRMVALTGGLSMENARDDDIDLLIVCAPGHLWTVRGIAVALVRLARLAGDHLCPNLLLSENQLAVTDENLYSAHEIVQMIPLYGVDVYRRFRHLNIWVARYLPNAANGYEDETRENTSPIGALLKRKAEQMLNNHLGNAIEEWEMTRKVKKLSAMIPPDADDVEYSSEACRGWVSGHGHRVLAEFESRINQLEASREDVLEYTPTVVEPLVTIGA